MSQEPITWMSVLIKLNYKLSKELETNVKFKNVQFSNFNIDQKKNQTIQPNNKKERMGAREGYTPRVYPSLVLSFAPIYFLAPATQAKQQPSTL